MIAAVLAGVILATGGTHLPPPTQADSIYPNQTGVFDADRDKRPCVSDQEWNLANKKMSRRDLATLFDTDGSRSNAGKVARRYTVCGKTQDYRFAQVAVRFDRRGVANLYVYCAFQNSPLIFLTCDDVAKQAFQDN